MVKKISKISDEDKRKWLVGLKKNVKQINQNSSFSEALEFYYYRAEYQDVFEAAVAVAFGTLGFTLIKVKRNDGEYDKKIKEAHEFLANKLRKLTVKTEEEFDVWHRKTAMSLMKIFGPNFTVGQAQKWINMALKHLSIGAPEKLGEMYRFCHIPIDQYIIRALKSDLVSPELREIDTSFGMDPRKYVAWSNISDYDLYFKFQREIRDKCGEIPFDFEFNLWKTQKERESGTNLF